MRKLRLIESDDDGCCCCHRCCQHCKVPMQYMCMYPDLVSEYCRLRQRYCDSITKRERLWALARPKSCKKPCRQTTCHCTSDLYNDVKVVRREMPIHTRTEQLAYPMVSKLIELKKRKSFWAFSQKRKRGVNRLFRKSLLSLYSRLSNMQTPKRPKRKKVWSQEDWTRHMKHIDALAKVEKKSSSDHLLGPKGPNKSVYEDAKKVGPYEMRHIKKLARPKKYKEPSTRVWHLTQSMREFTPSERLLLIAKPRTRLDAPHHEIKEIRPQALYYEASDRIRELALPLIQYRERKDLHEKPFSVSPRALKGKASQRIIDLSKPREFYDTHSRSNPFAVSRKALHAVITPRLRELARPRQYGT